MNTGSLIFPFLIAWSSVTLVWLLLFIYRGLISRREEDQVHLDKGEEWLAREQVQVGQKLKRLSPYLIGCGVLSLCLLVALAALWIYNGIHTVNY